MDDGFGGMYLVTPDGTAFFLAGKDIVWLHRAKLSEVVAGQGSRPATDR